MGRPPGQAAMITHLSARPLNYQIEHHLFESMPRPNLRRVQVLVRDFCAATDLGYREESFVGSFRQIVHHLSDAGAAACPRPD
jgi:fatty acid desaturase